MGYEYEKEDFLTVAPYEALYQYHRDPFIHAAKQEALAAYAKSVGFTGFKGMYKKYVDSLRIQNDMVYIDNATAFSGQLMELNAGDWEADDDGVRRAGEH